ncbi:MAG: hypothetical protein IPO35_03115 [Uliginosibacterium sp.]|nr:hypothetical protein [Uliginosibacterium sp.]
MLNRLLIACLTAFLLLAQLGALTHALSHGAEVASAQEAAQKSPAHTHEACAECLAFAVFGAALAPHSLAVVPGLFAAALQHTSLPTAFVAAPAHFHPRAPPPAILIPA